MTRGIKKKYETVEEFEGKINEYFETRELEEKPLTMTSLAVYLGMCRETFWRYSQLEGYKEVYDFAKTRCEAFNEEMLYFKNSVTGSIFNLKCNYGWKEEKEEKIKDTKIELEWGDIDED